MIAAILPGVLALALMAAWIYALVDVITTDEILIRNLPKLVWLVIVFFLWVLGAILWFALGRPTHAGLAPGSRHTRAPGTWRDGQGRPRRRARGPEDDEGWSDYSG